MATVKELQAKFTSNASGMESAFNQISKRLSDIEKATSRTASSMERSMSKGMQSIARAGDDFKTAGKGIQDFSRKTASVGGSLTSKITKPALMAGTAMAGITAKLGFDRLVGLDTAKAKLEGLGYSTKDVGRITDQVTKAIKGGMTTMAEGTDIAAGALAAGVKEGAELEKYIKLVGDAAVGSGRPVADMAQIFNRVQGQGKLMTQELNMVEEGMPGFSNAMAKHMGVSYEAFREMVTNGEVSSKEFLTVMDDFAGGMAAAYSKSFKGMVQNTKAYIGIIGESLLSGVFEKAKTSLHEFEKLLSSPAAAKWAEETGEKIGSAFDKMGNGIGKVVGWWKGLDKETQSTLGNIAKWIGITLVAIGPLLTIFAKVGMLVGTLFTTFGTFLAFFAKFVTAISGAQGVVAGFTSAFPKLASAIGILTGPVGWITLGIVALGTAFTVAYAKSETFRRIVNGAISGVVNAFKSAIGIVKGFFQLFKGSGQDGVITLSSILPPNVVQGLTIFADKVKGVFTSIVGAVKDFAMQIGGQLSTYWNENGAEITEALQKVGSVISATFNFIWGTIIRPIMGAIWSLMKFIWPAIRVLIVGVWNNIKGVITGALDVILGTIKIFSSLFTGNWKGVWQGILQVASGALRLIWNAVQLWFIGRVMGVVRGFAGLFRGLFTNLWGAIRGIFTRSLSAIVNRVKTSFTNTLNTARTIYTAMNKFLVNIWTAIRNFVVRMAQNIWTGVRTRFNNLLNSVRKIFSNLRTFAVNLWQNLRNRVVNFAQSLWTGVRTRFNSLLKSVRSIFSNLRTFAVNLWQNLRNRVVAFAQSLWSGVRSRFTKLLNSVRSIFNTLRNVAISIWNAIRNRITKIAQGIWNNVRNRFNGLLSSVRGILTKLRNFSSTAWNSIRSTAVNMATRLKNSVVDMFKRTRDGIKGFVKGIKDMVIGMKDSVVKSAKELAGGLKKHVIGGLNLMIDGVNKVGDKLGMGKNMIPRLHTGTQNGALTDDTLAVVGDKGRGNGPNGFRHETIQYPNGKTIITPDTDTLAYLPKGTKVANGKQTYNAMNDLPRFADGSGWRGKVGGWLGRKSGKNTDKIKKVSDGVEGAKKKAKEVKDAFDEKVGDVFDYISNPGKLVDKVMSMMGVDFSMIKGVPGQLMGAMYKKLKGGVKNLFKGWLEEADGGDIDGSGILSKGVTFGYSPNKPLPGYPKSINGGRHYGIDTGHVYDKIQAPMSGKAKKQHDIGGGTILRLAAGRIAMYFAHLSKVLKQGQVKQGDDIAITGNSGAYTTGAHLHTQVEKGPTPYLTNTNTMDPVKVLKGMGGAGGGKAGKVNKSLIVRALRLAGLPTTSAYINAWSRQIMTESGGNPKAIGGTDGLADGRAKGLVQVKPGTFAAYKHEGMNDIFNPLHNLVAGMNYAKRRYGNVLSVIGKGHGYAEGGIINSPEMAWLAEGGFSESVISHDPSLSARSKVIWDRTGEMLGFSEDAELLREIITTLETGNSLQAINNRDTNRIANKDTNVYMDSDKVTKSVNKKQGSMTLNANYNLGLGGV